MTLEPFFLDALRHLQEHGEAEFYTIEQALRFMELIEGEVLVSTGVGWTVRRYCLGIRERGPERP